MLAGAFSFHYPGRETQRGASDFDARMACGSSNRSRQRPFLKRKDREERNGHRKDASHRRVGGTDFKTLQLPLKGQSSRQGSNEQARCLLHNFAVTLKDKHSAYLTGSRGRHRRRRDVGATTWQVGRPFGFSMAMDCGADILPALQNRSSPKSGSTESDNTRVPRYQLNHCDVLCDRLRVHGGLCD